MKKYESLKKVDLHCHLEGSLNLIKASKWSKKTTMEIEKALVLGKAGDLDGYKTVYENAKDMIQTKTRLREATVELCNDMLSENVLYAEIRVDPILHTERDLTTKDVVETVLQAIDSTDLKAQVILMMKRNYEHEVNKSIIDLAKKYLKKGVCAVDLGGDELGHPTKNYKELFVHASALGVPFVIHAGEVEDAKSINSAISYGSNRIGHGIKAITSFETMEKLKKLDIPLEICLTSNMALGLYGKYSEHPVQRLIDSGVSVVICTDNRTINQTTLTDEYNLLNKYFDLSVEDFNKMNRCAIMHSFLSDKEKSELLEKIV